MSQSEFATAARFEKAVILLLFGGSMLLLLWAAVFEPTAKTLALTGGLAAMMCAPFAERRAMRLGVGVIGLAILAYSLVAT